MSFPSSKIMEMIYYQAHSFLHSLVINNKYPVEHYNRIINANLDYPIMFYDGKIFDGVHRLAQAYLNNKEKKILI